MSTKNEDAGSTVIRCPTCQTQHRTPTWTEHEPEPVALVHYCANPGCPTPVFVAYES